MKWNAFIVDVDFELYLARDLRGARIFRIPRRDARNDTWPGCSNFREIRFLRKREGPSE